MSEQLSEGPYGSADDPDAALLRVARSSGAGAQDAVEQLMALASDLARAKLVVSRSGRMLDDASRDDVLQEVCLRILRGVTTVDRPIENFRDWVRGTSVLVLQEVWRRNQKGASGTPPTDSAIHANPGARLYEAERAEAVRACIDELPEHYRTAIVSRYFNELSHGDVAASLEKSTKSVQHTLARALRKVRACLERKGMTSQ